MEERTINQIVTDLEAQHVGAEEVVDALGGGVEIVISKTPLDRGYVEGRILKKEKLAVHIRLGEFTTHDQVREAVPLALEWRARLAEHQSRWLRTENETLGFVARLREHHGHTPAEIARELNGIATQQLRLCHHHDHLDPSERLGFLRDLGIGEADFNELVDSGLAALNRGEIPFEDGYPVDRDRVKYALKKWRGKSKSQ